VRLAIRAAKENTDLPVMATMTFDKGPRGFFTMMGVTPEQAVIELQKAGADVVGANCGSGIELMVELAGQLRQATGGYLLIHCNAGIPSIKDGEVVYSETPEFMAEGFKKMADMGVRIIGGCCGTGPDHIRALVSAVRG
jgi:5-methyltetrahydrofolate--homocysteine methyltransferase